MNKTNLEVTAWDEPVIETFSDDNCINVAKIEYKTSGHLDGVVSSVYVLHYTSYDMNKRHEAKATFKGFSIFSGKIGNKKGRIIFEENGVHDNGLTSNWSIKQATGELENISGAAKYSLVEDKVILESEF